MHIAYLARELRIEEIYVPLQATVFSALGMLTGALHHAEESSCAAGFPLSEDEASRLDTAFSVMRRKLDALLDAEEISPADCEFRRSLYLKFRLQPTALPVEIPVHWNFRSCSERAVDRFIQLYEDMYGPGTSYRRAGVELVKCRLEVTAGKITPKLLSIESTAEPESAVKGSRDVYFRRTEDIAGQSSTTAIDSLRACESKVPASSREWAIPSSFRPLPKPRLKPWQRATLACRQQIRDDRAGEDS